jgi:hypothetical protein
MRWRLIEVDDADATDGDLSDAELVGASIILTNGCGEPRDERYNVYWRARQKIQPQVLIALDRVEKEFDRIEKDEA